MMQRTANENAACLRRICKRSDQPKIERPVNNDARLILCECQSTSCILHSLLHCAEETQQGRNSCPRLQFGFQFGLYRCIAPLSFQRSISHCLLVFLFLADQIFYRSCVHRQHFRLRSFASSQRIG